MHYNSTMITNKTMIMAFKGKNPVRSYIEINGNYLGQFDKDTEKKINRFQTIC